MTMFGSTTVRDFALVIVGSGIADASCALMAAEKGIGPIALISKSALGESNTRYAQGGIAAAMDDNDSVMLHARDTLIAGAGNASKAAVRCLCHRGRMALEWLIAQGVPFDRANGKWALGLEGAHSRPRILHAGGDATGAAIASTLINRLKDADITLYEHTLLTDLDTTEQRVRGVYCQYYPSEISTPPEFIHLRADNVVLATGGAGQLYEHTTNPAVATGDGVACAYRAGAAIRDAEFYQFHPTALAAGEQRFLISEAIRGEGAVLRDRNGKRFMPNIHDQAELAPRDVVARAIARTMAAQAGQPVWLDARQIGSERLAKRFPSISTRLAKEGLSLSRDWLPVTPAAHYWMGGILTDTYGQSSLQGLFAIGETACSGVHGANRLASNSLLEGVVFAHRVIERLFQPATDPLSQCLTLSSMATCLSDDFLANEGNRGQFSIKGLKALMWEQVGLERDESGLSTALLQLGQWRSDFTSDSTSGDIPLHDMEAYNLLTTGILVCAAALARRESRGAHFRLDYPYPFPIAPRLSAFINRTSSQPTFSVPLGI